MSYLLSVIIPTRNRQQYCIAAVRQIMSLNKDIEICVQDNSDTDSLRSEFEGLKNLKYNHHKGVLSFVDNFSEAISLATGKYCCMIGDDDGILPNIINAAEYMQKNGVDALIPGQNAIYYWPSDNPIKAQYRKGYLLYHRERINKQHINPLHSLDLFLKNGALEYNIYDLPRLYHGIVKRGVLEEIKKQVGNYFKGLTPDIYMAVALSFVCKDVVKVDYPVTISGICPTSGSADSATGRHTGELKSAPHFRGHNDYVWDDLIPPFYSVETIWAETLVKAIRDFKKDDILKKLNLSLLYTVCMNKYPQFSDIIIESARINQTTFIPRWPEVSLYKRFVNIVGHIKHRLLYGKSIHKDDLKDITAACDLVSNLISKSL